MVLVKQATLKGLWFAGNLPVPKGSCMMPTVCDTAACSNLACRKTESLPERLLSRSRLIYGSILKHFFSRTMVR